MGRRRRRKLRKRLERRLTDFVVQALAEVAGQLLGRRVDGEESPDARDSDDRPHHRRRKHATKVA